AVCLSSAVGYLGTRFAGTRSGQDGILHVLAGFNLCYLAGLHTFYRAGVPVWCCALPLTISAVLLAAVVLRRVRPGYLPGLVLIAAVASASFIAWNLRSNNHDDNILFGRWMREHLPADASVYQVDGAGLVSYAAERSIINGDGLING